MDPTNPKSRRDDFPIPAHLTAARIENEFYVMKMMKHADFRRASLVWRLAEMVMALGFGALFALAFPAFDWSILGWIGLIPLLALTLGHTPKRAFANAYLWGFAWALCSFSWFHEIGLFFPLFSAVVIGLFPAVWGWLVPFLYRYLVIPFEARREGFEAEQTALIRPKAWREILFCLAAASLWVTLEWVRSWLATGLPWNTLATTQWQNIPLMQLCPYTGFYGMSFLVALMNVGAFFAFRSVWRMVMLGIYGRVWPTLATAVIVMFVVITVAPSGQRAMRPDPEKSPLQSGEVTVKAGMVQSNNPVAWGKPMDNLQAQLNRLVNESVVLAKMKNPDFIVWPETAMPLRYSRNPGYRAVVEDLVRATKKPLIIGAPEVLESDSSQHVNAALLIDHDGRLADRYHKVHVVPFGEYIPFGKILDRLFPDLRTQFALPNDLTPGSHFNLLEPVPQVRIGVNICFEDVFPYVSREFVRNGANVLMTITNDAWYPESAERAQHLANSVFRAAENRRFLVRTGNMTRACLIDPSGAIVRWFDAAPGVSFDPMAVADGSACFEFNVPVRPELTFYARYGDLFAWACASIAALFLLGSAWQWRRLRTYLKARRAPAETATVQS